MNVDVEKQIGLLDVKSSSVPVSDSVLLSRVGVKRAERLDGMKLKARILAATTVTRYHLLARAEISLMPHGKNWYLRVMKNERWKMSTS